VRRLAACWFALAALVPGAGCGSYFSDPAQYPPCTARCGPRDIPPVESPQIYRSSAWHFAVAYPTRWSVDSQDADEVSLRTALHGQFLVRVRRSGRPDAQLVQDAIAGFPSSRWQNVQALAPLLGAHIGFQDGAGTLYAATGAPPGGQAVKARIVIVAATRGSLSVTVTGLAAADPAAAPSGIPEDLSFDYVLTQFQWPAA